MSDTAQIWPKLAPQAELRLDPISSKPILLYPEGILHLNAAAHAILSRVNGVRSAEEIALELADVFEAPLEELRADILECIAALEKRRLILLTP
jgi:pyrroloquinoline quinone biosynthesis protein D